MLQGSKMTFVISSPLSNKTSQRKKTTSYINKFLRKKMEWVENMTKLRDLTVPTLPDPGKGVCADPVNGAPSWERGDRILKAGTGSVS
jgi:hypothetical protein